MAKLEPNEAGQVPVKIAWYGMATDPSTYKRYAPKYGMTFDGQTAFITILVPAELIEDCSVTGKGKNKITSYTFRPEAVLYITKTIATIMTVSEAQFGLGGDE